jgi:hypothetical protein
MSIVKQKKRRAAVGYPLFIGIFTTRPADAKNRVPRGTTLVIGLSRAGFYRVRDLGFGVACVPQEVFAKFALI